VSRKLLLADGSPTIRRVIELTFAGEDVQVVTVSDGEQAIQRIPVEQPDIVLADIGMPNRNGYEVAAFVKQHPGLSHVPVLLLAGAFEPVDEARARESRSDGVLVKPFEPPQVIARVRELIDASPGRGAPHAARSAARPVSPAVEGRTGAAGASLRAELRPPTADGVAGPVLPRLQVGAASADPATSLDDYFDRLDAALATRGRGPAPPPLASPAGAPAEDGSAASTLPTVDQVLSGGSRRNQPDGAALSRLAVPAAERPESPSTLAASPREPATAPASPSVADASDLPLPAEQGASDTRVSGATALPAAAGISEELVERIARRVIERLAPDAARALVADIVSDVAERLVRAEIDRIRKA
jgi:CheY-like chemotaxis protein